MCLTEPWHGPVDGLGVAFALGAAARWAAVIASVVAVPTAEDRLTWELILIGLGLAMLLPGLSFSLDLFALRRLTAATFGTLVALEPAIALTIGVIALAQIPSSWSIAGVALVVVAGIGAARSERAGTAPDGAR